MSTQRVSKEQQLMALAEGKSAFYSLIENALDSEEPFNPRKVFTVAKSELIDHFRKHPNLAKRYLMSVGSSTPQHDEPIFKLDGTQYKVAWMYHGEERDVRFFDDLSEAAAEYVNYVLSLWRRDQL